MKPKSISEVDTRKGVISLRWLLIILASYLTLFSYVGTDRFQTVFGVAIAFSLSNVALMLAPGALFTERKFQLGIALLDLVFVSAVLYFLRVPGTYLDVAFISVFLLAVLWRDLRLVLFSVFVVSLLFGVFHYFRLFGFELDVNIERFLTLSLFFVVSIFYVVLFERLTEDALVSQRMREENRIAGVMVEITRALSSSLNAEDVLLGIAARLQQVLEAEDCSILRIDPKTGAAEVMLKTSDPNAGSMPVELHEHAELQAAYESRNVLFFPDRKAGGVVVAPMVANSSVLGLIYVRCSKLGPELSDTVVRFFEVMASTAANTLRNAQLFEEVEHRARTDFLTGLPNHRFFQTTLSLELDRAQRHNRPLSLLIIDLDFLKEVNDRFGHPSGDSVIRTIAQTIRNTCRQIDFAARYGGEEFTVILPETPLDGAIQTAERVRSRIAAEVFTGIGTITASIGVSNYPLNALSKEDLIRVADQALYVAKHGGRDRVAFFKYQMITR